MRSYADPRLDRKQEHLGEEVVGEPRIDTTSQEAVHGDRVPIEQLFERAGVEA